MDMREEILKIQECKTFIECFIENDDQCAECRTNQILSLPRKHTPEEALIRKDERERIFREIDAISGEIEMTDGAKFMFPADIETWQALKEKK